MKIALLTCEKLPDLTIQEPLIAELAKSGIIATAAIWDDISIDWGDFDYLVFATPGIISKRKEFNLWLDQIEKLGIKTLNPIAVIKQNKQVLFT
jgi:hypothetical protein